MDASVGDTNVTVRNTNLMAGKANVAVRNTNVTVGVSVQSVWKLPPELNKPVIVASQLLESMIEYPTPTRAEVADISEAVRQSSDALILSGESAMNQFPNEALSVLRSVSLRIERWWREEKLQESMELQDIASSLLDSMSGEICNSAAKMDVAE
ncbi:hypothetical protein Vadar_018906 [Vaccinium darrowii]|nr:hypothetical protein Vadar_018906 [Vaccinium darrowii]